MYINTFVVGATKKQGKSNRGLPKARKNGLERNPGEGPVARGVRALASNDRPVRDHTRQRDEGPANLSIQYITVQNII